MTETRRVALLRGLNVGGKNVVTMSALRAAFEAMGLANVETLIQSGNVLFDAPSRAGASALRKRVEAGLRAALGYEEPVLILTHGELARVVSEAPRGFGRAPDDYRYDVAFVIPPLVARDALAEIPQNPAVDDAHAGSLAVYLRRVAARAGESRLSRLTQRPVYKRLTLRNWRTTTKLLERLHAAT